MENRHDLERVYTQKVRAGKRRTYFFDVRKTKGDDYYVTLTESTRRRDEEGYVRHKLFLYKEDFNRFLNGLTDVIDHVKTDLMPDYDYDEFERRQLEWEEQRRLENEAQENDAQETMTEEVDTTPAQSPETEPQDEGTTESTGDDDDMSW